MRYVLLATLLLAGGCSGLGLDDGECPSLADTPVIIEVRDSLTNAPAAAGASGYIQSGNLTTPLIPDGALNLVNGLGLAGSVKVVIDKPGYRTWEKSNVAVQTDKCGGPKSLLRLKALLQRS